MPGKGSSGIALVTTLMVAMVLLIAGLSLLTFVDQDASLALSAERQARACNMAQGGLDYYRADGDVNATIAANSPYTVMVPDADYSQGFTVQKLANGDVVSTGFVQDSSGKVVATRVFKAPGADFTNVEDMSQ